ncbi:MAG: twin-arginine translocation signal domain-containing protein [Aliidongia sp.]
MPEPITSDKNSITDSSDSAVKTTTAPRRTFLKGFGLAGAALSTGLSLPGTSRADSVSDRTRLSRGDIAILRLLAAAELIEADLWQQYAELGGVTNGTQNSYQLALQNLDSDGSQYITSNTLDEISHASFLNAYLISKGQAPVDFDRFRTLPSSSATGAQQIGRLTNLTKLTVDTSWYTRYRSATSPDFGATFPQALPALFNGQFPGIPTSNTDFTSADHIQAIANTAAFHFGFIEQAGSSLYASLSQKVTSPEVLRITLGIGGDEICHFLEWVDFSGNGVQTPVAPFTDPTNGLTFPDFNATNNPLLQTNLIFPVPAEFISANLPNCAVIRPISNNHFGAVDAINGFIEDGLFVGQSSQFIKVILGLAEEADNV